MTKEDLSKARYELGLTQSQLAEELGVALNTVSRWERGELAVPRLVHWALLGLKREWMADTIEKLKNKRIVLVKAFYANPEKHDAEITSYEAGQVSIYDISSCESFTTHIRNLSLFQNQNEEPVLVVQKQYRWPLIQSRRMVRRPRHLRA